MEEVLKDLNLLRDFVYFISDRCTDPQIQHTFFTYILVVGGHAEMAVWLNMPDHGTENRLFVSIETKVSFSDLQIMMQPIQPCIRTIYIDVLQALKSTQSGWHPELGIEHVADCEAAFLETLIHHLKELPIVGEHKVTVALKNHKEILQEMLNLLRANLINLATEDLKFLLGEIDA